MSNLEVGDRVRYVSDRFSPEWAKRLEKENIYGTIARVSQGHRFAMVQWDNKRTDKHCLKYLILIDPREDSLEADCKCPSLLVGHQRLCPLKDQYKKTKNSFL